MEPLTIIMVMALVVSVISGIGFYVNHTKPALEEMEKNQQRLNTQAAYFERLDELSKNNELTIDQQIEEVEVLAKDSAADMTVDEADDRIKLIRKHYYNNVFREQLTKSSYAIPHLFRIQSTRLFMDDMAELNEDVKAADLGDLLMEFEEIALKIYRGTHVWDSYEILEHFQTIQEQLPVYEG